MFMQYFINFNEFLVILHTFFLQDHSLTSLFSISSPQVYIFEYKSDQILSGPLVGEQVTIHLLHCYVRDMVFYNGGSDLDTAYKGFSVVPKLRYLKQN